VKNEATKSRLLKVRREGGSIVLAVGQHLPQDWQFVKVTRLVTQDAAEVVLSIRKVE
jgi:hypothetical protein